MAGLVHVLHAELFHLARQRVAPPAKEFGRVLLESVGFSQRDPDQNALNFWNRLVEQGIYANLALPPATPGSLSLIRCSISAAHTEVQIDRAIATMVAVGQQLRILDPRPAKNPVSLA